MRRIAIDPVTRVEGHGKVTILLDEENKIHQVRLHIVEFRGFERFIEGRPYWEVPVTVQRLCGICPVSHHLAAAKAMDIIAGYGPLPPAAEKLRRLMHYGQFIQSHALHFFHLASPDLLLGFDSDLTRRNIIGVLQDYPELAKQGVFTRKFGQEVIHHTAGKRIHGTGAITRTKRVDEKNNPWSLLMIIGRGGTYMKQQEEVIRGGVKLSPDLRSKTRRSIPRLSPTNESGVFEDHRRKRLLRCSIVDGH